MVLHSLLFYPICPISLIYRSYSTLAGIENDTRQGGRAAYYNIGIENDTLQNEIKLLLIIVIIRFYITFVKLLKLILWLHIIIETKLLIYLLLCLY